MFFVKLPRNRHPERSASPICRVTQRLWRGVEEPVLRVAEGTPAVLILPMLLGAFQPPSPHRAGPLRFFPGTENQELARACILNKSALMEQSPYYCFATPVEPPSQNLSQMKCM